MTKEELKQKVNIILSESDKRVANILLDNTLPQMQAYFENKVNQLRQQLVEEKVYELNQYEIAITVCQREKISLLEDTLFSMKESDLNSQSAFEIKEDGIYFPIWIEADDKDIEQYSECGLRGGIQTADGEFEAEFKLVKNSSYLDILKKCEQAFAQNGICWRKVNEAYLHKFFYLKTDLDAIQGDKEIVGYTVNDFKLEQMVHKNIVPLWNVRYVTLQANDFPVIQENKINYRYDFAIGKKEELVIDMSGCTNGYCARYESRLSFFTDNNEKHQFSFWKIRSDDFSAIRSDYLILTNGMKQKMWSSQSHQEMVHSPWELARRVNSLSVSDKVRYQGYHVVEEYDKSLDYVVAKEKSNVLNMCGKRNYLELVIENIDLPRYIYRNTIQYIVDAIQSEFREYIVLCKVEIL